jgi:hypothetical protein
VQEQLQIDEEQAERWKEEVKRAKANRQKYDARRVGED